MNRLRKNIKLILAFTLPVYLMVLANSMMNMHVHVLSNGMVVRHAHPFDHNEEAESHHQHTEVEFSFYEGFCSDFVDTSAPLCSFEVTLPLIEKIGEEQAANYSFYHFNFAQLRAPPIS